MYVIIKFYITNNLHLNIESLLIFHSKIYVLVYKSLQDNLSYVLLILEINYIRIKYT